MDELRKKFAASPEYARAAPFIIFLLLTAVQVFGSASWYYWAYAFKTLVGAWLIWEMRPFVAEMKPAISWEAIVVGLLVFIMWVGIDDFYPKFTHDDTIHSPFKDLSNNHGLAWFMAVFHIAGMTIVVPPLEEVFYRSFLYRYFVRTDFQNLPLSRFHGLSFFVTSAIFASTHVQWLAGLLCGFAYQWLVIRKNRLGDAIFAHALTNLMLGVYIVWKGAWKFW
jgi:hypothetical protein